MLRTKIARHLIKRAMRGRYSTFGELAKAANISTTTMTKATDSTEWRGATLDAIAHALSVSPASLLVVEEEDDLPTLTPPPSAPAPTPKASDTARRTQRSALSPPVAQATPQQLAAEAERRRTLLAQAAGRSERSNNA